MAIYTKAKPGEDIKNGCATICTGKRTQLYHNEDRNQTLENADALQQFIELDSRYKVRPSGWSH